MKRKIGLLTLLGFAVLTAQAENRTDKVQRETRAGAAGGAAVGAVVATAYGGPQLALAGANTGAAIGGAAVGTCSRVLRSGEVTRAKEDISRHKKNAKKAVKRLAKKLGF
jgi:hypothetical protein